MVTFYSVYFYHNLVNIWIRSFNQIMTIEYPMWAGTHGRCRYPSIWMFSFYITRTHTHTHTHILQILTSVSKFIDSWNYMCSLIPKPTSKVDMNTICILWKPTEAYGSYITLSKVTQIARNRKDLKANILPSKISLAIHARTLKG